MSRPVLHDPATVLPRVLPGAAGELSLVVPTYKEAANVGPLVEALEGTLAGIDWEVIFVDDDSPDGTTDAVRALAARNPRVRGIRRIGRRGLAGACIEGMLSSSAHAVAVMDCDFQHDETLLPRMLEEIKSGAGLVVATRYDAGGSLGTGFTNARARLSRLATKLTNKILRTSVSDPMSGFFMMERREFEALAPKLSTSGFKILLDILASRTREFTIREVPYTFRERAAGQSKMSGDVAADFLGLVVSKLTGDRVSPRFFMFALVGASGIAVHLAALKAGLAGPHLSFETAQVVASYIAMTWNFFLNNALTYRDRRLRGFDAIKGLVSFYLVCSVGTLANVGVAQLAYAHDPSWWRAGLAGAAMAAVFNYAVTSVVTWKK